MWLVVSNGISKTTWELTKQQDPTSGICSAVSRIRRPVGNLCFEIVFMSIHIKLEEPNDKSLWDGLGPPNNA